jgi:hypothetical protein
MWLDLTNIKFPPVACPYLGATRLSTTPFAVKSVVQGPTGFGWRWSLLGAVMATQFFDLLHRERIKLHYRGLRPEVGWDNVEGIALAI